jgi:hypothetical protein
MGLFNSVQGLNQVVGGVQTAFGAIEVAKSLPSQLEGLNAFGADNIRTIGLPTAGEAVGDIYSAVASFGGGDAPSNDWRVRLSLPKWPSFRTSPVLSPLKDAGGLIFPYTPVITINQQTTYTPMAPTHNNYAFNAFKSSDPGTIQIAAPMYVEDADQALYWIAMLHYLRSVSKMFSGNDPKAGNPPPVVNLNGYGNFVFKNVPVVVTGFNITLDKDCDYIFIIEDDMIILDPSIFDNYIEAYKKSGIHHFNYGPGSPFNRKQDIQFDLHNRHLLKQDTEPNPKMILDYKTVKVSLFEHTVAMFSFFTKEVLERVGLIDEKFYNAWEHVDHTYRIIKAGYHPPFWWFADLHDSHKYLTEAPGAIDNSSIANKTDQWEKNVYGGREIYKRKHGHYPNQPPFTPKEEVVNVLKKLKQ